MIKWNKHRLTVATLTDCHLEDIECGKYQLVEKNIIANKPSSAVLCCFKVSFTTKWKKKKILNRLTVAILKDFRLENMECSKYQLIFVTAEEVSSKPILFCLKK